MLLRCAWSDPLTATEADFTDFTDFTARLAWVRIGNVPGEVMALHQHWGQWSSLGSSRGSLGSPQGQSEEKKVP